MSDMAETAAVETETARFCRRDWAALGGAMLLSVLYFRVFGLSNLTSGLSCADVLPGFGVPVYVLGLFAAVLLYLGKRAVITRQSVLLAVAAVLLAASCCINATVELVIINCFASLFVGAMAIFSLSGQLRFTWGQVLVVPDVLRLSLTALFSHIGKPFYALWSLFGEKRRSVAGVAAGLLIAVPIVWIVVQLLSSADAVFDGVLKGLGDLLGSYNAARLVWRVMRTLMLAVMLFSALYYLAAGARRAEETGVREVSAPAQSAPYITVLLILDAIYLVFTFIQFKYLFGGAETAAMEGGYAEYARTGFFQLSAVTVINLAAVMLAQTKLPANRAVKILALVLLLNTAVILFSAVWRMALYISVYGLSVLRLMTLWGMSVSAVCIVAAVIKIRNTRFCFFKVFFAFALGSWVIFSLACPERVIAMYNAGVYLGGRTLTVDLDYLASLSVSALSAFEKLSAAGVEVSGYIETLFIERSAMSSNWTLWRV